MTNQVTIKYMFLIQILISDMKLSWPAMELHFSVDAKYHENMPQENCFLQIWNFKYLQLNNIMHTFDDIHLFFKYFPLVDIDKWVKL
jgi:hypothetical protein